MSAAITSRDEMLKAVALFIEKQFQLHPAAEQFVFKRKELFFALEREGIDCGTVKRMHEALIYDSFTGGPVRCYPDKGKWIFNRPQAAAPT